MNKLRDSGIYRKLARDSGSRPLLPDPVNYTNIVAVVFVQTQLDNYNNNYCLYEADFQPCQKMVRKLRCLPFMDVSSGGLCDCQ